VAQDAVAGNRVRPFCGKPLLKTSAGRKTKTTDRKTQALCHRRSQAKKKNEVLRMYAGNLINLLSNTLCVFGNAKPQTM